MKKDNLSPREKAELDKMWPKAVDYIIGERPEGMSFEEYKTRQRHMREMEKFRGMFYGYTPHGKIKKETRNNQGSSQGREEVKQQEVPGQDQTSPPPREGTPSEE